MPSNTTNAPDGAEGHTMTDHTAPTGVVSSTELGLLPIGTRIVFTKTLESGPDEFSPGNLYARKGDGGVITGHGTTEGYWVTWDGWKTPFGASRDEFDPLRNTGNERPSGSAR